MAFRRVCVFCGSNVGARGEYAESARSLGRALVAREIGLVYGGGGIGLMGVVAEEVRAVGGEVIGVIPTALFEKEVAMEDLADLRIVSNMHERKATMADLSDGFIAMPGGLGTLEELFEVLTWAQLGIHRKPIGLLDSARFFDPLLAMLDRCVDEGFLRIEHRGSLLVRQDPEALLDAMETFKPPELDSWWVPKEIR